MLSFGLGCMLWLIHRHSARVEMQYIASMPCFISYATDVMLPRSASTLHYGLLATQLGLLQAVLFRLFQEVWRCGLIAICDMQAPAEGFAF